MKKISILKLLWPEICPFCGRASNQGVCLWCRRKIRLLEVVEPRCMKCGKPVYSKEQEYCCDCACTQRYFEKGAALWAHKEPVILSVYQFKFHNQRSFGRYYAKEMIRKYKGMLKEWNPDVIIPIPLYKAKQRKRGYNQAAIVAKEIARLLHIAVDTKSFKRVRSTNPQKNLNPKERKRNLKGAFAVREDCRSKVEGKRVLLIDDIYTTGSTMDEAARTLRTSGAEKVFYLTISIGQGY